MAQIWYLVVGFVIAVPLNMRTQRLIMLLWMLQVSKIQVASVVAAALSNTTVSENKVILTRLSHVTLFRMC